ncbi:MAG: endolytic transglycosylase MltG [Rikenellaceae bacterium]
MNKSFFKVLAVLGVVVALSVAWCHNQFMGDAVDQTFTVSVGTEEVGVFDGGAVESQILSNVSRDWAFKLYSKRLNLNSTIKPGRYRFEPGMSVIRIVRMLKLGEQQSVNVTFNNVRTLPELAGRISGQLNVDSLELLNYLRDDKTVAKYGFDASTIFSMFIPNTYQFYWNTTPSRFVERMHAEYNKFWTEERASRAKALDFSKLEVMTLASIIYEETKQTSEMSRVAGVYVNRLKIGMPLQADPTVKYAVGDFTIKRVLHKHLKHDSPYNTYLYAGLPPSPIAMPSISAIDAVLLPEKHSYLYFCARPTFDGYHNFAKTLSEHNANAKAYINELNRLKIK